MRPYDVAVAYRIYPTLSKPAAALPLAMDKYHLSEVCLKSFKESLDGLRVKLWVLLDGCPAEYEQLFRRYCRSDNVTLIALDHAGNLATFRRQIDLLLSQRDADIVYFAEDDYFYLPGQFTSMIRFLRANPDVHFISPYDHPDCYRLDLHHGRKSLKVFEGRHWRAAGSTCLTFLTTRETLEKTQTAFTSYSRGNHDCSLWLSLTKQSVFSVTKFLRGFVSKDVPPAAPFIAKAWIHGWRQILFGPKWNLWMPIPGIATHLDAAGLSPAVDWLPLITEQAEVVASAIHT
jgi:hypothetical protein